MAAGRDSFGLWAESEVEGIPLRFRFVPPAVSGWLTEHGRVAATTKPAAPSDADPRVLAADAPCTQAPVASGDWRKPQPLQGADRPVGV